MTKLYEFPEQYLALQAQLESLDLDAQTVADTIEASGILDDFAAKAERIEMVRRSILAPNLAIRAEIARLEKKEKRNEKLAASLLAYLQSNMEMAGVEKLKTELFSFSVRLNPPSVQIDDAGALPPQYLITKPPEPSKQLIKDALKAGEVVSGARLVQTKSLQIK